MRLTKLQDCFWNFSVAWVRQSMPQSDISRKDSYPTTGNCAILTEMSTQTSPHIGRNRERVRIPLTWIQRRWIQEAPLIGTSGQWDHLLQRTTSFWFRFLRHWMTLWNRVRPSVCKILHFSSHSLHLFLNLYIPYPTELKHGRITLDISPRNRSVSDFSISIQGALRGFVCLVQSTNCFTAHSCQVIELKHGRMVLDISPRNCSKSDFSISFRVRCGARASCNLQIDSQSTVRSRLNWNFVRWYQTSVLKIARRRFFRFF